MRYIFTLITILFLPALLRAQKADPVRIADPFIGVYGGGNVHPAATLPYSVVSLGPDVEFVQSPSGYGYKAGQKIVGFSHVHLSGTGGGGRYGNFAVMPQCGKLNIQNKDAYVKNESASPAYYTCDFSDSPISAQLTLSEHVGFHQYTFKQTDTANILLDVSSTRLTKDKSVCTEVKVELTSPTQVQGYARYEGGWGGRNPYTLYFYAEFEKPCVEQGTWKNGEVTSGNRSAATKDAKGVIQGAFFRFKLAGEDKSVRFKLAVSYLGVAEAKTFFAQIRGWDFDALKRQGEAKWSKFLNRITVEGGSADQQKLFYTSFYRTAMLPRDLSEDNPLWKSAEPHYWDFFTFWDTYRTLNPLLTVIDTKREASIISCLLDIYKHKGWMPDSWSGGDYGDVQGGSNVDVVVGEAILKGIKGFDYETAYQAMLKDANVEVPGNPRSAGRYVKLYNQYGYIPVPSATAFNKPPCGTSRTLEYSYDDYCIAMVAKKLGRTADHDLFLNKSAAIFKNLYCDSLQVFWAKDAAGKWIDGFNASYSNGVSKNGVWMGWAGPYYEGSPWSYSCATLQDIPKLIQLHGGKEKFTTFLDTIFDTNSFEADNEPAMHIPYMYIYAGNTHKTYERLKDVLATKYKATKNGLPGNDDAGAVSAWYMWATMGIYPVVGQNIYLLTTPFFKQSQFHLENKKSFTIVAKGLSDKNSYIQSAKLNGKDFNQAWMYHDDIMNGGTLEFTMGDHPSSWGSINLPPSFDQIK